MAHIHTKPGQHDTTASAFVVRIDENNEPRILLHRHKKLHKLLQPGGHVELNENPWRAIIHELREETGYEIRQLKVLQSAPNLSQNSPSNAIYLPIPIVVNSHRFGEEDHFHDDLAFAFLATNLPNNEPDDGESRDFHWLNLQELDALTDEEIIQNVRETSRYVLENFADWRAENTENFLKEEK